MRLDSLVLVLACPLCACGPDRFPDWPAFGDDELGDASSTSESSTSESGTSEPSTSESSTSESSTSESSTSESSTSESSTSETSTSESSTSETGCIPGGADCACIEGECFGDLICAEGLCHAGNLVCGSSIALRDARIASCPSKPWVQDDRFGNDHDLRAEAFVSAGSLFYGRILLEFDLASIPAGPLVLASIELSPYTETPGLVHAHDGTPTNAALLLPILDAWNEGQANWENAPAFGAPYFEIDPLDEPDLGVAIDITAIVIDMRAANEFGQGFALQLVDESPDTRLVFASDEALDEQQRPRLSYCVVAQ